jgi:hypothetical protein
MKKMTKAMYGKSMMKSGGAKKMQDGGMSAGQVDRMPTNTTKGPMDDMSKMKTGGMVNPNAKLQASKKAGSKGVMHSLSAKAVVQKKAKGRSGGTSKAPKTATPKAKYGMIMRKK